MLYVRWLGAFRKNGSLHESLKYELNRHKNEEVAVEPIKNRSYVFRAKVGLLVDKKAVIKTFNGDCWSEYKDCGVRLYKTRNPRHSFSRHMEGWAYPIYIGIVVCSGGYRPEKEGYYNLSRKVRSTIKWYSNLYNLPIYHLVGDKLKEVNEIV